MMYQHPLAYLLGIEGIGLLRAFRGEFDREFVTARLAEVRRLLDDESLADAGVEVDQVGTVDGYRVWSATYDDPGNAAFDIDTPVVQDILDGLPVGTALDAACGTGRLSTELLNRGHRVIGVDSSPDMLARARDSVPEAEFLDGDLRALPVPDDHVDLVLCGLALSHVSELRPVFAEFARVLRPGGHVVVTDMHPESLLRGVVPAVRGQDGRPGRVVTHRHLVGDYLRAALAAGLVARRCEEPAVAGEPGDATHDPGPWEMWPWTLAPLVPEAAHAASAGVPVMMVWDFQLELR